jgi:hypothetical protein
MSGDQHHGHGKDVACDHAHREHKQMEWILGMVGGLALAMIGGGIGYFQGKLLSLYIGAAGLSLFIIVAIFFATHRYVQSEKKRIASEQGQARQKPPHSSATGRSEQVVVREPDGERVLNSVTVPLFIERSDPYGWTVRINNNGDADLTNPAVTLQSWEILSPITEKYARRRYGKDVRFQLKRLGGMSPRQRGVWLLRYEDAKTKLRVGNAHTETTGGTYRAALMISADGYQSRTEEHCFEWHPGKDAVSINDPTK